ncbi:MAG TPA: AraC family transcriptional regulator [Ohtaekwangia sp.]|nr:AraC family transcriptional regulator [Ohtaekwangia sp.]
MFFVEASMILTRFPDLQWLKRKSEAGFNDQTGPGGLKLPQPGWPTVILNVTTQHTYRDNIRGPLSLFTNMRGESSVSVDGRRVKVGEGQLFLSNHGQRYTLEINQKVATQTFNIHFGEFFTDQVWQSLTQSPDRLLETCFERPVERLAFHNRLQHRSTAINSIINNLKGTEALSPLALEENLYALVTELCREETAVTRILKGLPVIRSSTRTELVKRLMFTTDYIHTFYHERLSLDELAGVACLSKFHFLRLFKIAFHKTPHQFITEVRLQEARSLLRNSALDIRVISRATGFENASSFSRAFYQSTGVYPSAYRLQVRGI